MNNKSPEEFTTNNTQSESSGGRTIEGILKEMDRRRDLSKFRILVLGAGEMASGVAHRLHRSGFCVFMTEIPEPLAIRRHVCFSEAIRSGSIEVDGVPAEKAENATEIRRCWDRGVVPVVPDAEAKIAEELKPNVVVDATMRKKVPAPELPEAEIRIGTGPGFHAGRDVDLVVETHRGHDLGRVIDSGQALADTGIPGAVGGYTNERVLRAPGSGFFRTRFKIGDTVKEGDTVAEVSGEPIRAEIDGILRGLLPDDFKVKLGLKVGDIDPRCVKEYAFTISDKARAVAGGVLEAILFSLYRANNKSNDQADKVE